MKVLLCPDSFKDALGAEEAAKAMAQGIQRAAWRHHTKVCPWRMAAKAALMPNCRHPCRRRASRCKTPWAATPNRLGLAKRAAYRVYRGWQKPAACST